jgi:hypothetical protein
MDSYNHNDGQLLELARRWSGDAQATMLDRVRTLAEATRRGVYFDPIRVVFGLDDKWSTQDGHHRVAASLLLHFSMIPAVANPDPWPWLRKVIS